MKHETSALTSLTDRAPGSSYVAICPFVNEPLTPWHDLLPSRDVARLILRPKWLFYSLTLIGRFPRRRRFRGRSVRWLRWDIQAWVSTKRQIRGYDRAGCRCKQSYRNAETIPAEPRSDPHQRCLPLDCTRSRRRTDRSQIHWSQRHKSGGMRVSRTSKCSTPGSKEARS
jgi:predicted DNA-binding transcriptional regulator AlpA